MIGVRRISIILGVVMLGGCDCSSRAPTPAAARSKEDLEAATRALAKQFGKALMKEDYKAAYALLSSEYQSRLPFDQFESEAEKARSEHGEPLKVEADIGVVGNQFFISEGDPKTYGFSPKIPPRSRLAWAFAKLALEVEGDDITRCYEARFLVVDDDGALKLGHVEYDWCD